MTRQATPLAQLIAEVRDAFYDEHGVKLSYADIARRGSANGNAYRLATGARCDRHERARSRRRITDDIVISRQLSEVILMPNILIRDLSQEAVERIDAAAANLGLSRNEYLRRKLEENASPLDDERRVTAEDWQRSGEVFADLADHAIMDAAWR